MARLKVSLPNFTQQIQTLPSLKSDQLITQQKFLIRTHDYLIKQNILYHEQLLNKHLKLGTIWLNSQNNVRNFL